MAGGALVGEDFRGEFDATPEPPVERMEIEHGQADTCEHTAAAVAVLDVGQFVKQHVAKLLARFFSTVGRGDDDQRAPETVANRTRQIGGHQQRGPRT